MMFVFVIYNSIYIPINIAFNVDKPLGQCLVDLLIDILFISDMLLNLRTAYYNEDNELVLDAKTIYREYLCSTWFVIDFLAVFPFDLAIQGWTCGVPDENAGQDTTFTTAVKLLKALRLLRLVRFRKELDRLNGAAALRVAVALFIFLLWAHWLACVWWAVGTVGFYQDGGFDENAVKCDRTRPCSWFRRTPEGNLKLSPDVALGQQYLSSLYWSLTTLMKTPWIGPDTVFEKVVLFLSLLMSAILNANFLSTVQGSYNAYNKASAQKRDKLAALRDFMDLYNFKSELRQTLLAYTHAHHTLIPSGMSNVNVLMQLPSHLRNSVTLELYTEQCGIPMLLFPSVSTECAKSLVARLNTQILLPHQLLIAKGEVCQSLYFLLRGVLKVTSDPPSRRASASKSPVSSPSPRVEDRPPIRCSSGSRTSTVSNCLRLLERSGSRIGLIEPVDRTCLGVYPVYVSAGSKTALVMSITQRSLAETLDSFGDDVVALREGLVKEHKVIMDGLKVPETPDSPLAASETAKRRKEDADRLIVDADAVSRVRALEGSVRNMLDAMNGIQQSMQALPQILELVDKCTNDSEAMKKLTAGGSHHRSRGWLC